MAVLEGKTALVTGGSRGIGRAIVERLVREGASAVFGDESDEDAARSVQEATGASGRRSDTGDVAGGRAPSPTPPTRTTSA